MTKKSGFKIRIDAFVEIDRKDYGKQAAAYAMMAEITSTNKLPDDFFAKATIISIDAKQGSAEIAEPAAVEPKEPVTPPVTDSAGKKPKPNPGGSSD